jgi:hypothetical protein
MNPNHYQINLFTFTNFSRKKILNTNTKNTASEAVFLVVCDPPVNEL